MACDPNQQITQQDLELFKANINAENEHVNSPNDTFVKPGGGTGITQQGIENAAAQQRQDIEDLANDAIDTYRRVNAGFYSSGPLLLPDKFTYAYFNGGRFYALNPPYTTDPITFPDATTDSNLIELDLPDEQFVIQISSLGDSQVANGRIHPESSAEGSQVGDSGLSSVSILRDASTSPSTLYRLDSSASGTITALDFTARTATIGGVNYKLLVLESNLYSVSFSNQKVTTESDLISLNSSIADFGIKEVIVDSDVVLSSGIAVSPARWVSRGGSIIAQSGVSIQSLIELQSDMEWSVDIDMGQTASTTSADNRCVNGIYIKDKSNISGDLTIKNVRFGRPIFIEGTSGNSMAGDGSSDPTPSDGSKNISFHYDCDAFESSVIDDGCFSVIRSDFYDGGAAGIISASNGINQSDGQINSTYTYPATTTNITFKGTWKNHDRLAILNASEVKILDYSCENFGTRGFNFSPTCFDSHIGIGKVTGEAAAINFTFCRDCTAGGLSVDSSGSGGQRFSIKAVGSENITFYDIVGKGGLVASLEYSCSKHISFDSIKLNKGINPGSGLPLTIYATTWDGAVFDNYVTEDIVFDKCSIAANNGFQFLNWTANSTIAIGGVKFRDFEFRNTSNLFDLTQLPPRNGILDFQGCTWDVEVQDSNIEPRFFSQYAGNIEPMNFNAQVTASSVTTIVTITGDLFWWHKPGPSDFTRMPDLMVFKNDVPLMYQTDWFMDGPGGSSGTYGLMSQSIRLSANSQIGDVFKFQRLR